MLEITLYDSNFLHQEYLTPYLKSNKIIWKRDNIRRNINIYTDNFIKKSIIDIPTDDNLNICVLLEPLTNPPWTDIYDYIQTDYEKFDLIITHNIDQLGYLISQKPEKFIYSTVCNTSSWLDSTMIGNHKKNKMISMPFSWKTFSEGHQLRHAIYNHFKGGYKIDFYGSGVPNFSGEFRECFIEYKYTVVCENTLQKGFNSDRLRDAILTKTIPIYWGPKIYGDILDEESIFYFSPNKDRIDFDFSESLSNLEKIVDYVYENDPYNSHKESIESNFNNILPMKQSEDNIYNILLERGFIKNSS